MVTTAGFTRGALAGLCLAASAAWAAPLPQGAPFRVSSCPDCRQTVPAVGRQKTGALLPVWEGLKAPGTQSIKRRVFTPPPPPPGGDLSMAPEGAPAKY